MLLSFLQSSLLGLCAAFILRVFEGETGYGNLILKYEARNPNQGLFWRQQQQREGSRHESLSNPVEFAVLAGTPLPRAPPSPQHNTI